MRNILVSLLGWIFFSQLVFAEEPVSEKKPGEEEDEGPELASTADVNKAISDQVDLLDSFHEASLLYQLSTLPNLDGTNSGGVHLFQVRGSVAVWPRLHLGLALPLIFGGGGPAGDTATIGNWRIEASSRIYSNLAREFPHFIYVNGYIQFPRRGDHPLIVNRTDLAFFASARKMFYQMLFESDLGYIFRLDGGRSSARYGNLLQTGISANYHFELVPIYLGGGLLWRYVSGMVEGGINYPSQAVMTLQPVVRWEPWGGVFVDGLVAFPLRSGSLGEVAKVFGDYQAAGLWSTSYQLNFQYQF